MPYVKYRPFKQHGKMNTRVFRQIYWAKMRRMMPRFIVPKILQDMNVPIYDPNAPDFPNTPLSPPVKPHKDITHPNYHKTPCLLFDGTESLAAGFDQACQLTKSIVRPGLPLLPTLSQQISETKVREAIMHAHHYDGTLEKLPRRRDPVIFWRAVERGKIGITEQRANSNLLQHLVRLCLITHETDATVNQHQRSVRMIDNREVHCCIDVKDAQNHPLVMRFTPSLTLLTHSRLPICESVKTVALTSNQKVVDVKPIDPYIDAKEDHVYAAFDSYPDMNTDELTKFLGGAPVRPRYLHTMLTHHVQNQYYPWTESELRANALLTAFCGAVAMATKVHTSGEQTKLSTALANTPVVTQCIQLTAGVLDMCVIQLNTLDIKNTQKGVKNLVWMHSERLYEPHPQWDHFVDVKSLNMSAFDKFRSLVLNCGKRVE